MATTVTSFANQSMFDVIIMACGSLEAGMQFCNDNGVSISDIPAVGTVYVVSDAALALGNAGMLQYLSQNGIVPGNLGVAPPVVEFEEESGGDVFESEGGSVFVGE